MKMTVISRVIANFFHLVFAVLLVALSVHLILLAIGHILESFRVDNAVDVIFNAIWLITVAIVVFDLGVIIFDEIIWEGRKKSLSEFKRQFNKFLIVIITALLIETLVVFFRVAKKGNIPLSARIIAIVDAFDALTTDRPYRTALPSSAALAELALGTGTHFDPALVKIFAESIHSA